MRHCGGEKEGTGQSCVRSIVFDFFFVEKTVQEHKKHLLSPQNCLEVCPIRFHRFIPNQIQYNLYINNQKPSMMCTDDVCESIFSNHAYESFS